MYRIGIDIGGTGIKAGLVDLASGTLAFERVRILTPQPSTRGPVVETVVAAVAQVVRTAVEQGLVESAQELESLPLGAAFPGAIKHGRVVFLGNLDQSWVGEDIAQRISEATGRSCYAINDADAAGLAEMTQGAGAAHRKRTVIMTTLGTGIGTALFHEGRLFPNTELGHLEMNGMNAERQAAQSAKAREDLSYEEWAERLQQYYSMLEMLFTPDLFIVGGGISKSHKKFLPLLDLRTPIVPAQLRNAAGIIGAAQLAANRGRTKVRRRM